MVSQANNNDKLLEKDLCSEARLALNYMQILSDSSSWIQHINYIDFIDRYF